MFRRALDTQRGGGSRDASRQGESSGEVGSEVIAIVSRPVVALCNFSHLQREEIPFASCATLVSHRHEPLPDSAPRRRLVNVCANFAHVTKGGTCRGNGAFAMRRCVYHDTSLSRPTPRSQHLFVYEEEPSESPISTAGSLIIWGSTKHIHVVEYRTSLLS